MHLLLHPAVAPAQTPCYEDMSYCLTMLLLLDLLSMHSRDQGGCGCCCAIGSLAAVHVLYVQLVTHAVIAGMHSHSSLGAAEDLQAIFGLHVWPFTPSGTLASRAGPIMAAALQFEARVSGRGGHAAMPPAFIDPVVPAAAIIGALQARPGHYLVRYDAATCSVLSTAVPDRLYSTCSCSWALCRAALF